MELKDFLRIKYNNLLSIKLYEFGRGVPGADEIYHIKNSYKINLILESHLETCL